MGKKFIIIILLLVFILCYGLKSFGQNADTSNSNDTITLSPKQIQAVRIHNKEMPKVVNVKEITKPHVIRNEAEFDTLFTEVAYTEPAINFFSETLLYIPYSTGRNDFTYYQTIKIINNKLICHTDIIYPFIKYPDQPICGSLLLLHKDLSILIPKIDKNCQVEFIYNEIHKNK
ncbi:MAG: hypothetical protein ACLQQ4_10015 [Bacteroidia bacterium]